MNVVFSHPTTNLAHLKARITQRILNVVPEEMQSVVEFFGFKRWWKMLESTLKMF